jgi:CPA2 family monovalent cation:H+ antiporter-2
MLAGLDVLFARPEKSESAEVGEEEAEGPREPIRPTSLTDHVVLVGHGRVGRYLGSVLRERSTPLFVIEDNSDIVSDLKAQGVEALSGNAADPEIIAAANLGKARCLLVAIPDAFEGGQVVQQARAINADLPIIARAHSEDEIEHLMKHGANLVIMGEHEIAKAMAANIERTASAATRATAST